jgi:galactofuranose transport system substrate-binding protein
MLINRRHVLIGSVGAAAGLTIFPAFGQVPPLKKKDAYKVGFAQTESNNPWRLAQTQSMKDEAAKRGAQLVYTDAAGSAAKQVADVNSMIAQGVDFIFLPPREEKPLIPAVLNAKKAGIPVLLVDRNVDPSLAKPGVDFLAFIGSNFIQEGQRVAEWTITKTGGKGKIIELEGSVGASPANDRKKGFDDTIKSKAPDMVILASQSGDFARDKGRQVAETLLQAHPDATIVYAHNDEMALGAIAAIEAAGKVPGKDILVVSIDGEKDAVQAIIDGKLGATCECNPRFGPAAFDILYKYANGDTIAPMIINPDRFFDATNAKDVLSSAF